MGINLQSGRYSPLKAPVSSQAIRPLSLLIRLRGSDVVTAPIQCVTSQGFEVHDLWRTWNAVRAFRRRKLGSSRFSNCRRFKEITVKNHSLPKSVLAVVFCLVASGATVTARLREYPATK